MKLQQDEPMNERIPAGTFAGFPSRFDLGFIVRFTHRQQVARTLASATSTSSPQPVQGSRFMASPPFPLQGQPQGDEASSPPPALSATGGPACRRRAVGLFGRVDEASLCGVR